MDGEKIKRLSVLADTLPIQVITPESFSLLFEGPKARRQFIDWGAFHCDPQFYQAWVNVRRILKQRNQLLKDGAATSKSHTGTGILSVIPSWSPRYERHM